MFCSKCGRQITDGAAFCSGCGAPVGGSAPAESGGSGLRINMGGNKVNISSAPTSSAPAGGSTYGGFSAGGAEASTDTTPTYSGAPTYGGTPTGTTPPYGGTPTGGTPPYGGTPAYGGAPYGTAIGTGFAGGNVICFVITTAISIGISILMFLTWFKFAYQDYSIINFAKDLFEVKSSGLYGDQRTLYEMLQIIAVVIMIFGGISLLGYLGSIISGLTNGKFKGFMASGNAGAILASLVAIIATFVVNGFARDKAHITFDIMEIGAIPIIILIAGVINQIITQAVKQ